MLGSAWDTIGKNVEHEIPKQELLNVSVSSGKGKPSRNQGRLDSAIGRLVGCRVKVRLKRDDGKSYTQSVSLLEEVHEPIQKNGTVYFKFPKSLRKLILNSSIFARIQNDVMLQLSSRYSLSLYEMISKRINLKHQFSETFTVEKLRGLLGVPKKVLHPYKNFKANVLLVAITEVNYLANYGVTYIENKKGKNVISITLGWHQKSLAEIKESFKELRSSRMGCKVRMSKKSEQII